MNHGRILVDPFENFTYITWHADIKIFLIELMYGGP